MNWLVAIFAVLFIPTLSAFANESPSPYAGQQTRDIKALSEKEISDYLAGRGMGLAKAAELNRYPGPRHVLDAAKQLALTSEQRNESEAIFSAMQVHATRIGMEIVAKERELDRQFAEGKVTDDGLRRLLNEIAVLQGELRFVHLRAHVAQRAILTSQQLTQYDSLRGYRTRSPDKTHHGH